MTSVVYSFASSESQANEILTHLRNLGFSSSEISVLLKDQDDTRNIALHEDAVKGATKGGVLGGFAGGLLGLSALTIPGIGVFAALGPILSAFGGAAVGSMVGGLSGGATGGLAPLALSDETEKRVHQRLEKGDIFIGVHSDDPVRLNQAIDVFKSAGANDIYYPRDAAA